MSTRELLADFLSFLKKPEAKMSTHSHIQGLLSTIRLWGYLFVFIIVGGVVIDALIDVPQHDRFQEVMDAIGVWGFMVFAVLLGPLLEEVAFRLAFRFRLRYVFIGVTAFVMYMTQAASEMVERINANALVYLYGFSGLLLLIFLWGCVKYTTTMARWWTTHFYFVFYLSSVSFAMIHIFNFEAFPLRVILLAPLITLPQFILGLGMGYLRMRFGFWYGYLFHVLNNGFALSVYLLLPE